VDVMKGKGDSIQLEEARQTGLDAHEADERE
jgi:hypothetical protein